jgi:hypothetical protein
MKVALLTSKQSDSLRGVEVVAGNFFNPIQDADGNWIISIEEVEQTDIEWVKKLPLIEYRQETNINEY